MRHAFLLFPENPKPLRIFKVMKPCKIPQKKVHAAFSKRGSEATALLASPNIHLKETP